MKCIIKKGTSEIVRVTDEVAAELFSKGLADYASKAAWKAQRRREQSPAAAA